MPTPISAIVLTFNEERNIEACLDSLRDVVDEIVIVDSYSTDKTLEIAGRYDCEIVQHPFENYSQQRNWALDNLKLAHEWVLNLDADHRVSDQLRGELTREFARPIDKAINGYLVSRRTMFMGRWMRHGGHYPVYQAPLFRRGCGRCEDRLYDQHFVVTGECKLLRGDIIDAFSESLTRFTARHNVWSDLEIGDKRLGNGDNVLAGKILGDRRQRRRALRNVYDRSPLFVRAFGYFVYRYFLRLGFRDGIEGLIFHTLQGFWFRVLIDAKLYESRKKTT